jgi:hypothetical protein
MVVRILTFFVWRISVLRIDLRIKEHISEEMGVTSSQAFNDLDTYPVCFPPAHETPITSAPDHVMVSGARYELGRPIPMDIGIRFRWHLGRPVLAQAIDETGMPLQHVPPINLDDPGAAYSTQTFRHCAFLGTVRKSIAQSTGTNIAP